MFFILLSLFAITLGARVLGDILGLALGLLSKD